MMELLRCEFKKTRRRYITLTTLGITGVELAWVLYGDYNPDMLRTGWMMFLYQMPLYNALFIPILAMVISSRLCDLEHKGVMFKQLCSIMPKGKLYDAKLLYGLGMMWISVIVSWIGLILFGIVKGFEGALPIRLYLFYLLFTLVPATVLYVFQHTLSMLFRNQAVAFFTGIIGEFLGVFSMFLSQIPFLRSILIWGSFGVLQFVGMYGWTNETRMSTVYYEVMDIDWLYCVALAAAGMVMYLIGRKLFCESEG
ncbi:MAG: ABC transporter permease [bacterium]|nr:ABC transporter permease [bacterium]